MTYKKKIKELEEENKRLHLLLEKALLELIKLKRKE
jgi:hypothetical protein